MAIQQELTAEQSLSEPEIYQFEFTGSGQEYFKIWIVNMLLTILTFGIYSAWAKVRLNQYIYRSVKLDNSGFEYHGTPIAILKGRIIMVLLIFALNVLPKVNLIMYFIVLGLFLAALPWLIVRSLAFNMRNSSWRGIHFRFKGSIGQAAECIYAYGLWAGITLGIGYPAMVRKLKKFLFDNTFFGESRFSLNITLGSVYKIFLQMLLAFFAIIILCVCFLVAVIAVMQIGGNSKWMMSFIPIIIYFFLLIIILPFYKTKITNLIWNNATISTSRFRSVLTVWGYLKIIVVNFLLTVLTLGFYWPWAFINIIRFRMNNLSVIAHDGLNGFIADASPQVGAAAEEISSAFDLDISF